ncbi:MAG: sugar ABC transporter permease [Planctomycetota bacterium]
MSRRRSGQRRSGVWFALPWLIGLGLLYVGPMLASALLAFAHWDGMSDASLGWAGGENFRLIANDAHLTNALVNSVCYTAMNVPAQLVAGLGLALLVRHARGRTGLWATLYYMPHVLGGVATILIWWWLLNPQVGPINRGIQLLYDVIDAPLRAVGGSGTESWAPPPWLYSPTWAKPSLVLMNLWQAGGGMLVFLAALLRGGDGLHDAAKLDGAGVLRRFWHVTLPQVSPAILFNLVTGVVFSMQAFSQPFLLRNFQQQDSLLFYALYMYQTAFERHRFGYAAAQAWVLLAVLLLFTAATVVVSRRWVFYEMDEEGS